ncbi:MAG: zeta toxin family protein [Phycisphaeraceae bacterium]
MADDSPICVVIGGPNGAGKTTAAQYALQRLGIAHFVNADTIARGLSWSKPESVALAAGRLMIQRLHELRSQRASFGFETTLAGRTHARFLADLKSDGYRLELHYVWLKSADLAVARVQRRVEEGGHNIPEIDIRRRYARSAYNLLHFYLSLMDDWIILDNSENRTVPIAESAGRKTTIYNPAAYESLQRIST